MIRSVFQLLDHHPALEEGRPGRYATLVARARRAEDLGYDTFWLAEHHFSNLGTMPNPAVLLAALAAATERIRLGPAVSVLPFRSVEQVAEDYALVDVLSNGRLRLGVGAGSREEEFVRAGVDYEGRLRTFEDRLERLRSSWSVAGGDDLDSINVKPLQADAPLLVATTDDGRARALGRSGTSMLTIVTPAVADLGEIETRLAAHAEGLKEGGHERSGAEAVVFLFSHVDETDEAARAAAAPALARVLGLLLGAEVPDGSPLYDMMAERGTGVFGSASRAEETLRRLDAIGATHVAFLAGFGGLDPAATDRAIELLAPSS